MRREGANDTSDGLTTESGADVGTGGTFPPFGNWRATRIFRWLGA